MARVIAVISLLGAMALAVYDVAVKHVSLTSFKFDPVATAGLILTAIALVAAFKIKPRGR